MNNTVALNENKQFKKIYHRGKTFANHLLVIYVIHNNLTSNRLGITVNKKVGKAVTRNRVRRLIRESYRLLETKVKEGNDIIFVSRVRAKDATYAQINSALFHLLKKMDLFQ